ncbi:TSUP family transporter [Vibrio astriarenae]
MTELIIAFTLVLAGFIRGYTGFGFSAIVILVLSAFYPVAEMVPAVLLLDLMVSLPLVAQSWNRTDFKRLTPIFLATIAGVPFGYLMLIQLPDEILKIMVPATILALAAINHTRSERLTRLSRSPILCGFMSGWSTSAVSAGGAPVVIYMRYSDASIQQQRDSLISYFFITACFVVGISYIINKQWYLMPEHPIAYPFVAVIGLLLGKLAYHLKSISVIHQGAFYLMLSLSGLTLAKAIWTL